MAYKIKYTPAKQLSLIEKEWRSLEIGKEMTLFQSYDWYNMLLEYYIPEDTKNFVSVFAVIEDDGKACMIAPLWIITKNFRILNRKGVFFIGRYSFSDYLNFIYKNFDSEALNYLLADLHEKFGVNSFTFEDFRKSTSIYDYISNNYKLTSITEFPCVDLIVPHTLEEYKKMLSKNSRQNLRTANNRLKRDGKTLTFNLEDLDIDIEKCMMIRESKLMVKYNEFSLWRKYKYRIINRFRYTFPPFFPLKTYPKSKIMTAYDGERKLRAFFNYGYDPNGKAIRIMAAGTDLDFARYSPGILLMHHFITNAIEERKLKEIDFTRGDEKYKFALGGQQTKNLRFTISLK